MTPLTSLASNTATSQTGLSPQAQIGQEFNSFIRLLTAQVQNQDPLSPLDSTQFVEQLATFSALEQQVRSNSMLEGMAASLGQIQLMAAQFWGAGTAGVSAASSWIGYEGGSVPFSFNQPEGFDAASLVIRDATGAEIARGPLALGEDAYAWEGITLPEVGRHMLQFSVELGVNGAVAQTVPVRFL